MNRYIISDDVKKTRYERITKAAALPGGAGSRLRTKENILIMQQNTIIQTCHVISRLIIKGVQ